MIKQNKGNDKKAGLLLKFEKFQQLKEKDLKESASIPTIRIDYSVEHTNSIQSTSIRSFPKLKIIQPAISTQVIKEQSKIYGRFKDHAKLSSWQVAVNDAAFVITQEAPHKMYDCAQLKLAAEEKACKSYIFK
ncbi:Hypothetical predicted protein [Paramuricea clavata]|uniref:Uncharacterized protein n=1 Tax=Paramuricea clavata TaxID=317549 RepID=A0A7D9HQ10_PARCT|nr:Hypothetical predicted protein [Paramuricea clavata]